MRVRCQRGTNRWASIHVFYDGSLDDLLLRVVVPAAAYCQRVGLIRKYFFIRYAEGGMHVRLRVLPYGGKKAFRVEGVLKARVVRSLAKLIAAGEGGRVEDFVARARNCIQEVPYARELGRYGGTEGVKIAEYLFWQSSMACAELLKSASNSPQDLRLAMAIQLHLVFVYAGSVCRGEVIEVFGRFVSIWKAHCVGSSHGGAEEFRKRGQNGADLLEQGFQSMGCGCSDAIRSFALICEKKGVFSEPFLERWRKASRSVWRRLKNLYENGKLDCEVSHEGGLAARMNAFVAMSPIVTSYMHMTNNRLGIYNTNEALLAYVVKRSLQLQ